MLLYLIAVPVAFLVAQGFWTLIAYIITWCGFPKAGSVVFWVSLAFTSLGAISALTAFAWTQTSSRLDICSAGHMHWLRTVTRQRGEIYVFMEPDRPYVRRVVRYLPSVGQDLDLLVTAIR